MIVPLVRVLAAAALFALGDAAVAQPSEPDRQVPQPRGSNHGGDGALDVLLQSTGADSARLCLYLLRGRPPTRLFA